MKTIVADPDHFFEQGDWGYLLGPNSAINELLDKAKSFLTIDDSGGKGSLEDEGKNLSDLEEEAAKVDRIKESGKEESRKHKPEISSELEPMSKKRC